MRETVAEHMKACLSCQESNMCAARAAKGRYLAESAADCRASPMSMTEIRSRILPKSHADL